MRWASTSSVVPHVGNTARQTEPQSEQWLTGVLYGPAVNSREVVTFDSQVVTTVVARRNGDC